VNNNSKSDLISKVCKITAGEDFHLPRITDACDDISEYCSQFVEHQYNIYAATQGIKCVDVNSFEDMVIATLSKCLHKFEPILLDNMQTVNNG